MSKMWQDDEYYAHRKPASKTQRDKSRRERYPAIYQLWLFSVYATAIAGMVLVIIAAVLYGDGSTARAASVSAFLFVISLTSGFIGLPVWLSDVHLEGKESK